MRRLSIFLPRQTAFYVGLLAQIRRGFEAIGIETTGACQHLDATQMRAWCAQHRPDVVFEMNRPKRDVPWLPPGVRHIVWVVDFNGRPLAHFEGSDITYLFSPGWPPVYPHRGFHRFMGPGTDPTIYQHRAPGRHWTIEGTFVGHIPRPWSHDELARNVTGNAATWTFDELRPWLEDWLSKTPDTRHPPSNDALEVADHFCRVHAGVPLVADDRLRYDIRGRIIRHIRRRQIADAMLTHLSNVAFFGPENWSNWPQYAPHWRGQLDDPSELAGVYQRSRFNFHEGNGIHFRSMDIMATGGLLLYREHWHDHRPKGIADVFDAGIHYVPFRDETLGEVLDDLRHDPTRAQSIREAAAEAVFAAHTWTHRARDIVRDLHELG